MSRLIPKLSADERAAFIANVRLFMTCGENGGRVKYKHRGRSFRGVDCIGMPAVALAMLGYRGDTPAFYSPAPDGHTLRDGLIAHFGDPIPLSQAQPGDIPLMRWHQSHGKRWFNHVGVLVPYYLGGLGIIHSLADNKEVVEHNLGTPWDRRIVEVYSL